MDELLLGLHARQLDGLGADLLGQGECLRRLLLLLGEGVVLLWLGAILRWCRTFFAAIGAVVVASLTLVAEPVSAVNTDRVIRAATHREGQE